MADMCYGVTFRARARTEVHTDATDPKYNQELVSRLA